MSTDGQSRPKPSWFQEHVESINPDAQRVLESYSGMKPEEVIPHVVSVRNEAFEVYQYACIGQMRFLSFNLQHLPFYPQVLEHLRHDPTAGFLDAGCCFAQELRYLADQGIPSTQLYGCDLEQIFISLGYQLFRDEDRFQATFAAGDLATENDQEFEAGEIAQKLRGRISVVFASSLFHMWNYQTQLRVATRLVRLCRDDQQQQQQQGKGTIIAGRQMGSILAGEHAMTGMVKDPTATHYRHNVESIKGFWYDVGVATNTRWRVEAGLYMAEEIEQNRHAPFADENLRMLWWCATRVD
ncbi:class I SAM-dependent methyltransferase [Aspergillus saccharolyticus JOP 1030-1]|uniref:Methyltransferase domain-containing protein n=1 Tax=Aspergillus saccharolyticus JOP 1030-1 TaxID=1450539 RepID=A0A319AAS8_9EURO|nr:hypothetical protein BP01DRAFT_416815 [Aspergillus saccharolyticus JOP 1030-1]PYH44042.1 hypothetical protein BP01DRAFT_416815 [Aspergillus saccharolyticus JOP 1030-1]